MKLLGSVDGVYNCSAVGYCSEVCPKHVDPGNAVNVNKINAASQEKMAGATAGMQLPPGFKLPF